MKAAERHKMTEFLVCDKIIVSTIHRLVDGHLCPVSIVKSLKERGGKTVVYHEGDLEDVRRMMRASENDGGER